MKVRRGTLTVCNSLFFGTALAALTASGTAFAQAAPADKDVASDGNELITVIARKATESLQDVPVTVTAVSKDTIERYQVKNIEDVVNRVPTLSVQVGGSGSGGSISLRGIGSSAISAAFDSAVALDFDGIQLSSMRLVQGGFFDVQQIDVLKGPQSLYFGKSASGGVFSLRSTEPTKKWEVGGKASYEFEEHAYLAGGYISGPLTDTLGVRVAAQYSDATQYTKIQPGIPALIRNRGNKDFVSRVTLQWNPSSAFSANLKLNYVTNRNDGAIGHQDIFCGPNRRADEVILLGGAIAVPSGANCNINDHFYAIADPSATQAGGFPTGSAAGDGKYPGHPFGRTNIFLGRLRTDLKLNDQLTLTTVSGYFDLNSIDSDTFSSVGVGPAFNPNGVPVAAIAPRLAAVNTPGSAQGFGTSDPQNTTKQYTQEVRLASKFDSLFNFTVGVFYEHRNIGFNTSQQAVNISIIAVDPVTGSFYDYFKKHLTKTDTVSAFGSGTIDITKNLQLTGGIRWTHEDKVNTITVPYVHAFLSSGPAFIKSGFFSGPINFKDTNYSPEVSLRYKVNSDVNIYAAYKTGFKSGGIDNSALPSSNLLGFGSADPAVRAAVANGLIFKSETGKGGEAGVKALLANRTLTVNASAFYYIYKNLQLQAFDAVNIQFKTFNASEVTTKGADLDLSWRTPVNGLKLNASLAYTNAKFTKSLPSVINPAIDLNGRDVGRAPKFAGNVGFDYKAPVSDTLELGISANGTYSSSYFTANTNLTTQDSGALNYDYKQPAFGTIDGALSIGHKDGKWRVSLVGVNITDKHVVLTSGGRPFLAGAGGLGTPGSATFVPAGDDLNVNLNRGRQVFVETSFKF